MISLALALQIIRLYMIKNNKKRLQTHNHPDSKSISIQQRDFSILMSCLYSHEECDKVTIKRHISKNSSGILFKAVLYIINVKGYGPENIPERRKVNKNFMNCLVDATGSYPSALIWMKKKL